jgi:hypothetical protein
MPRARFNGTGIRNVVFDWALLDGASFGGCTLSTSTSFRHSTLSDAAFGEETVLDTVDFRWSELGGVRFGEAKLILPALYGATFGRLTDVDPLCLGQCREAGEPNPDWRQALSVYATLRATAAAYGDFANAEWCAYQMMTCKHRHVIGAHHRLHRSEYAWAKRVWADWLRPSLGTGPRGWAWLIHRTVWGYGYRPMRLVPYMLVCVVVFAVIFFAVPDSSTTVAPIQWHQLLHGPPTGWRFTELRAQNAMLTSLGAFLTLGALDQSRHLWVNLLVGAEAFSGMVLLNLFLVAWARKLLQGG